MTTTVFWVIAGVMALAAVAPLYLVLRKGAGAFAAVVSVVFLAASVGTYVYLSDYDFDSVLVAASDNPHAADAADAIAQLAENLAENPDDLEGWKFLGRSYRAQERYREAANAFERAYELAGDDDPVTMLDLGEALLFSNAAAISGRAGELFEEALALAPDNPRALWYGGLAAANRGERLLAAERWEMILETDPPEDVRGILENNIRELRAAAGVEAPPPGPMAAAAAEMPRDGDGTVASSARSAPAAQASPETGAPAPEPAPESAAPGTVPLRVTLSPELAARAPDDATLFIFARTPGVGGPPIAAVRRRAGELPLSITLSDANAMMAGRQISTEEELELIARVALGGSISESEGDLIGDTVYRMGSGEIAQLVIDEVVGR